jgi:hypothetical protein
VTDPGATRDDVRVESSGDRVRRVGDEDGSVVHAEPSAVPTRGIVYLAMGERFVEEAAVSAASARRHLGLPITLFTDCPSAAKAIGCFDEVVELSRSGPRPHRDKIVAMRRSPYERTLFLDTDTFVGAALDDCWELLEHFDLAVAGDRGYVDEFPPDTGVPPSFKEPNLGVVFYRRCRAMTEMLDEALAIYDDLAAPRPGRGVVSFYDQPAVRLALFRSALRFTSLCDEDNCRFANYGKLNGPVRVLHGRLLRAAHNAANLQRVLHRLNTTTVPRVFVAGRVWALWPRRRRFTHEYRAAPMPSANVVEAKMLWSALKAKVGRLFSRRVR